MRKPFTFQFLLIFFTSLSVLTISHGSFEAESDPLSSNDKLNKRLSKERETWRKKKEEEPPFEYHGFVLTTIDVKRIKGSKKVQFSGAIEANLHDQTAIFLHNVVDTGMKDDGMPVFEAERVDREEVSRLLKGRKLLISVHGHGREPLPEFKEIKEARPEFKHHEIIPLFWPTFDLTWKEAGIKDSYDHDVAVAEASGRALATFLNKMVTEDDPNFDISMLTHSMGNRVLEFFARQAHDVGLQIKFRNIFMVAADIDRDVFESNRGEYIVDMLSSDSGKVYVAFRWNDAALASSALLLNGEKRLGQAGANLKYLPSALDGKVKNMNMAGFPADSSNHNYQYFNYLIWFYDSK